MIPARFRSVRSLPAREMAWLLPLLLISAGVRAAMLIFPFGRFASCLGMRHGNFLLSPLATQRQLELARRIGALTASVARCTPWQSKCLVQALMAKVMLNHYNIPYVLYLGVAKAVPESTAKPAETGTGLIAHAWLVVGSLVVTGAAGCNAYSVVSTFASPSLLRMPRLLPGRYRGAVRGERPRHAAIPLGA